MLVYFGKDGTLKEIVSSYTLSNGASAYKNIQGSSSNEIYCYYEGREADSINVNSAHITFAKEGVVVPADVSAVECGDWYINFDRKQDLRYFEYEKEYRFAKFAVPSEVLGSNGLACATSRIIIDSDIYSYGMITFNVSKSVVLKDSYITQSQYDYLLSLVTNVQVNVGDGLLKEEGVIKVDWTKVAKESDFEKLNKVMPTDIDYKDGFTLMHDTEEITGQVSKVKVDGTNILYDEDTKTVKLNEKVTTAIGGNTTAIQRHTGNTSNPHKVTKEQVGLGNVENKTMDSAPTDDSENYVTSGGVKKYVDDTVEKIRKKSCKVVDSLPEPSEKTLGYIYLIRHQHEEEEKQQNYYDEYVTRISDAGEFFWEKLGDADIDLSGYVPTTRKVNGKTLEDDIDLTAENVGVTASGTDDNLEKISVDGKEWNVKGNETYTNATPTPTAIGGIAKGSTFDGKTMEEMWSALLYPYIAPSNLSLTASEVSGVFEKGTTLSLHSISYSYVKNSGTPTKLVFSGYGNTTTIASGSVPTSGTYNFTSTINVTANGNCALALTYEKGTITSNTISTTFVDPYYYGVGAQGVTPTTLTKIVGSKSNRTLSFSPSNQYIVYAYPKSYGHLKSIKDSNGFENINGFTETTATLTVKSGNVDYYVYTSNTASTQTNFALTFSY